MSILEENSNQSLIQLFLIEFIKEYEKIIENTIFKDLLIQKKLEKLGKKPGFSIAFQLLEKELILNDLNFIGNFLSNKFSKNLFGINCNFLIEENKIILKFNNELPFFFKSFKNEKLEDKQLYWFLLFINFLIGLFSGALINFSKNSISKIIKFDSNNIELEFKIFDLNGDWSTVFL